MSAAMTLCVFLASCTAIGPTVEVSPGGSKSPAAFADDRASCGRTTDEQLQPIAAKLSFTATSSQQAAENNQRIQEAYNTTFGRCMALRGNIVPVAIAANAASTLPVEPDRSTDKSGEQPVSGRLIGGWKPLGLSYHTTGGRSRDVNDTLWSREIANLPSRPDAALAVYSVVLDNAPRSIIISVASLGPELCDSGPNDVNSTRDYAVCPGKLGILVDGKVITLLSLGPVCAETINVGGVRAGTPGWKNPVKWGTRVRYDVSSATLKLVTMQNGRVETACSKTIKVP